MGTMKHGANAVERYSHARPSALRDFGAEVTEERLDVGPPNVRLHRVGADVGERLVVLAAHAMNDTMK